MDIRRAILNHFKESPGTEDVTVTLSVNDAGDPTIKMSIHILVLHADGTYTTEPRTVEELYKAGCDPVTAHYLVHGKLPG